MSRIRVASVSFLNARPLIHGLEDVPDVDLSLDVPAKLLDGLRDRETDVALLPVIDFQRLEGLTIVPVGGIGSDGPTHTVRIFSRVPIGEVRSLACDTDSHTSVALARIILARRYGVHPEFCELTNATDDPSQARLLIGDKVVCAEPTGFSHQLDLGGEWKAMTGLPFVFAVWMARQGVDAARAAGHLDSARRAGLADVDRIVRDHALPRGWPEALAREYLTRIMRYDIGACELTAIRAFHALAVEEGVIASARPLRILD